MKLEVISSSGQTELPQLTADTEQQFAIAGYVEFAVSYLQDGKLHQFIEVSRFLPVLASAMSSLQNPTGAEIAIAPLAIEHVDATKIETFWQWRYVDGVLTSKPSTSIGRNDTCPCGSGKKFKQCLIHQPAH